MYIALVILQVLVSMALVTLVLLQHGKGADAGAAFGSGASATVFGARGSASFLTRATGVLATVFFLNSLALSTPLVIGRKHAPVSVTQQVPSAPPADGSSEQSPAKANSEPAKPSHSAAPAKPAKSSKPADVPAAPTGGSGGTSGGAGSNTDLPPN